MTGSMLKYFYVIFAFLLCLYIFDTRKSHAELLADYGNSWILNETENRVENPSTGIWTTVDTGHAMPQLISLNKGPGADSRQGYLDVAVNGYGTDGDFKINFAYDYNRYHTLQASKGCNRMVLYMKIPNGDFTFHIGTYTKDPNGHTTQLGTHYYHYFRLKGDNKKYWTKLLINEHPQHLVGEKYDPGDNPTIVRGWNYFDGMSRMYLEMKYSPWSNDSSLFSPYKVSVDEILFYTESRKENTYSINSIAVTYFGDGEFNIDWRSFSQYEIHYETFEVRYSTSPIVTETDYENAELVPGSPSGGWGQENVGHHDNDYRAHFVINNIHPETRYYFAIKDLYPGHPKEFTTIDYFVPPEEGSNMFPSANAGQDQMLTDNDGNGSESVALDGSGSSDPDGTIVSYVWSENGTQIAQGEMANVELAVGIHDITLEVTDNDGATDTDVVRITVQSSSGNSLAISDVAAICPTDQNVTIKWVTDQLANGKVEYGTDTSYGQETAVGSSFSKNHCIVLTGLSANTTYHFRVISQDSSGNTGISDDYTFTTLPDHSNGSTCIWIEAENGIINSPMQIETDSSASNGKYITTPQGTGSTTNPSAEAVYDVDIRQAGDYYIWLLMYGPSGNNDALYIGPNGSFDRVYPSQSGQYEWVQVEVEHNSGNYAHHLNAGINRIAIGHGEELARADKILITDCTSPPSSLGDTTPPGDITNFTATPGDRQITLSWTNPSDSDFAGVMIRYRTDGTYPQTKDDGLPVPNGNGGKIAGSPGQSMSYVHTNLDSETHYYYSAFSYDTSNNYSQTAHADAQPLSSNNAPVIENFTANPTTLNNPGETTTFNVSATDPDGDSLTYTINFGDGTANGHGSQVVHTYEAKGTYTAEVSVDDGHGHTVAESLQMTVNDIPPAKPTNVSAN